MIKLYKKYREWLHTQWPDGRPEPLPQIDENGMTSIPGIYVVGDLTGLPLLKFSADTGSKAVQHFAKDKAFANRKRSSGIRDVIIVGAGVSGYSAALKAREQGIDSLIIEANQPFSTIENFPKGKPIYSYPKDFTPNSEISFTEEITTKEALLENLKAQIAKSGVELQKGEVTKIEKVSACFKVTLSSGEVQNAHRIIVAIGRSGNYRKLCVEGEELALNRLHDPADYKDKNVVVVGGGDSAVETAVALAEEGSKVTLSYRKHTLTRPKPENLARLENARRIYNLHTVPASNVSAISEGAVELFVPDSNQTKKIKADTVFSMLGREAPLAFFRNNKIAVTGDSTLIGWLAFACFMLFAISVYDWKNWGFLNGIWELTSFPNNMPNVLSTLGEWWQIRLEDRTSLISTIAYSMKSRSFYYTLIYTSVIGIFGYMRIRRRKTAYVKVQTITLFGIQAIPLFLLPEVLLPYLGYNGFYSSGFGESLANSLFPSYISAQELLAEQWPEWGHPRAYWHAYGFILAWPLNVYNVFTPTPIAGWLIISAIQTFVIIPLLVYKWGKGAYCGWICSCGALAETVGDNQRHKMPHGPFWNKLNMLGQFILLAAIILLVIRVTGWLAPETVFSTGFNLLLEGKNSNGELVNPLSWKWIVDVLIGGILGVGLYFKFSGRTWCRFACPLAALMHIYARFSKFRIFAEKSKCISCNQCTSVCHQGIDVMSFANKGKPMSDPQCVRCSACVSSCPTGVLSFGEIDKRTGKKLKEDELIASNVRAADVIKQVKV
ncbi:NAD(P)-binding domain-containing protein [Alteromonas sp. ALT199]|uniref:NAD(P)-binding domain-containing protein n=1 Tax=unclassified Alteromonas TaxID=2614992 RepID=UPI00044FF9AC|nr:NAD(P)-binding domain-containing protein [Alteromonas sp. ALT199]MBT3134956.1 NAD(P)-binding domain-containing protein [Alteromonas sp. ALT199]